MAFEPLGTVCLRLLDEIALARVGARKSAFGDQELTKKTPAAAMRDRPASGRPRDREDISAGIGNGAAAGGPTSAAHPRPMGSKREWKREAARDPYETRAASPGDDKDHARTFPAPSPLRRAGKWDFSFRPWLTESPAGARRGVGRPQPCSPPRRL